MVYARQVPPEYQQSPMEGVLEIAEECDEWVTVTGNNRMNGYKTTTYKRIEDNAENAMDEIDCIDSAIESGDTGWLKDKTFTLYETVRAVIEDLLSPDKHRMPYTDEEIDKWHQQLCGYTSPSCRDRRGFITEMLHLMTGLEYIYSPIHGCSQSDWNEIYYPKMWEKDYGGWDYVKKFQAEYFNTGEEWEIHDGYDIPEDGDDVGGHYIYIYDNARIEIAEETGVEPEDVVLFEFGGWVNTPKYVKDVM